MLTVPDAIKALYKADGVYKNFRAHFPNGERADITNGDVVRESLSFTESICSDDVMRFGGCERSVIEFETVGVENILGATIECGIEIDTSSLSAAQLADIGDDPGDGVLVLAAASDIGVGYYRIPLGTFVVSGCPRNHENVAHRRITAYTPKVWQANPIEEAKLDWFTGNNILTLDAELEMLAVVGYSDPSYLINNGWTLGAKYQWWNGFPGKSGRLVGRNVNRTVSVIDENGEYIDITISGVIKDLYMDQIPPHSDGPIAPSGLARIYMKGFPAAEAVAFLRTALTESRVIDYEASALSRGPVPISTFEDLLRWELADACAHVWNYDAPNRQQSAIITGDVPVFYADGAHFLPKFYSGSIPNTYPRWVISIPDNVTVTVTPRLHPAQAVSQTFNTPLSPAPEIARWVHSARTSFDLEIKNLSEAGFTTNSKSYVSRAWFGAEDQIAKGWMEINGAFLACGRFGPKTIEMSLDGMSPVNIAEDVGPGDYASCWWSEYDPEPIRTVKFNYGKDHDQPGVWGSVGYGSVYDLSDNAIFECMVSPTAGRIRNIISTRMRKGLQTLSRYVPAELTMPAWPWLEAGDTLKVTAADGARVRVGIFRRTMTGIQMLMDSIEAPGGDLEDDNG